MSIGYMMDGWQTETYINKIEKNTEVTQESKSETINPPAAVGWICPKCGAGMAPWVSRCPCQDKWEVTC